MQWWFLILACSAGATLWAAIAAFLRVRRHMQESAQGTKKSDEQSTEIHPQ